MQNTKKNLKPAFTLIEMLLAISLFAMAAAFSIPVFTSLLYQNEVDGNIRTTVQMIRTAQNYAMNSYYDDSWSVRVASGTVTVYKGNNFATRDSNFDIVTSLNSNVSITGTTEFNFGKNSGDLDSTKTLNFSGRGGNKSLSINVKGGITYS